MDNPKKNRLIKISLITIGAFIGLIALRYLLGLVIMYMYFFGFIGEGFYNTIGPFLLPWYFF